MTDSSLHIAFFEVEEWEEERLRQGLEGHRLTFFRDHLEAANLSEISGAAAISVFIRSHVDGAAIDVLPELRLIATRSTGYDHLNLQRCNERGITVCNVPYYGENTVAEHTFGLILSLSRNIHKAYIRTVQGQFSWEGLRGFDLKGKTLGVIGAGSIGLHVIRMAKGFAMRVLAYDKRENRLMSEVLGFEYVPMETLLAESDIITLHAPLTPATHHLINRERLQRTKRGALLINTARGGLVDTDALLWALDQGILRGAGLDVVEGEELIEEEAQLLTMPLAEEKLRMILRQHVLLRRENVVITPHSAFNSTEAMERIVDTTIENIRGYLAGSPQNVVNPDAMKPQAEKAA